MPDRLHAYRSKRSANQTGEPFGGEAGRGQLFVVQAHSARRMHFDFRLELEGVLKSWAVPQGPSRDPSVKRFAIEVEDHPVEYADFEGVIPKGNYGAGPVIVWDRGEWVAIEDPVAGLESGKLLFDLKGTRLRGRWTLVRTKKPKEWLLIKKPDTGATTEPFGEATSILSGRTLEQLASGASAAREVRAALERLGAPKNPVRPGDVKVMLAESREHAFTKPGWIFELKYDGFRGLASRDGAQTRIHHRSGQDATASYPDLVRALNALPYDRFVLDGEIVVLDDEGQPSFQRLQGRAMLQRAADLERAAISLPATYYAFDLLGFEDFDLRSLPLIERKKLLSQLVPKLGPIRYADHIEEQGHALLEQVRTRRLEGIIGKRAASHYVAGRSSEWLKVRLEKVGDFAVVGYTEPKGQRTGFGALHLGGYENGTFIYAGRVGTGFSEAQLESLIAELAKHRRATPACGEAPKTPGRGDVWVEPTVVVEVRYHARTDDGLLRQPAFLRVRTDKPVEECVLEARASAPESPPEPERKVPFSNLRKVFWPSEGFTKGDLIDFYREISPWLLPYLRDRPLVMTRYPDGIDGKSFYQKDAPGFAPSWLRTVRIYAEQPGREIEYFICDDVDSLLYVANLGSIPLHVWASRASALQLPDWSVIDLDPKDAPFSDVITLANSLYELCNQIGLPAYCKTSGQSGLHVLIPLGGQCTYVQSRQLAQLLSRTLEESHSEIATTQRVISARGKKVYLDCLQNLHGQTIAAPFSVRPRPGAPVSVPLEWSEVRPGLDPRAFNLKTVAERMGRMKQDPLVRVLAEKPDLTAALDQLAKRIAPNR